jgi:hypothetical protein
MLEKKLGGYASKVEELKLDGYASKVEELLQSTKEG